MPFICAINIYRKMACAQYIILNDDLYYEFLYYEIHQMHKMCLLPSTWHFYLCISNYVLYLLFLLIIIFILYEVNTCS